MSRGTILAVALGGLVLAGTPLAGANAQSRDARDDFYRGAPNVAYSTADAYSDASQVCSSYGLNPHTLGYRGCIDNEVTRRGDTVQAISVPDDTPHMAVTSDSYGFGYDRQGNLLDNSGYVIRPAPLNP